MSDSRYDVTYGKVKHFLCMVGVLIVLFGIIPFFAKYIFPASEIVINVIYSAYAGAAGYLISTFWMKPIIQYGDLRRRVLSDLIFYAQVNCADPDNLSVRLQELYYERILSNRKNSADLCACIHDMPSLYKFWIQNKGHDPDSAVRFLIGLSNSTDDYEKTSKVIEKIKKNLGINSDSI